MNLFLVIAGGILGLIVGSFLNVVTLRMNTGKTIGGRSHCMQCNRKLDWWHMVPFFSYLFLRGRCDFCKSSISVQYPIVELATGIIFALVISRFGFHVSTIWYWIISSILVVIAVYDLRHFIIPWVPNLLLAIMGFITLFIPSLHFVTGNSWFQIPTMWNLFSGVIIALPFFALWLVSRGRWLGLGDVKYMVSSGWLLGLLGGVSGVLYAFWIGAAWVIVLVLVQTIRKIIAPGLSAEIPARVPFGPFLVVGTLLVILSGVDIQALIQSIGLVY
ncbi:MAG: prepilin peptidase [Candidatus Nomurabacteria bacterium]|nr:prepilin peptidase [Candidatus Nomurabacteria bacterium]